MSSDEHKTLKSLICCPKPDAADCLVLFVIAMDHLLGDTQYVKLYLIKTYIVLTMGGHPKALQALMSTQFTQPQAYHVGTSLTTLCRGAGGGAIGKLNAAFPEP